MDDSAPPPARGRPTCSSRPCIRASVRNKRLFIAVLAPLVALSTIAVDAQRGCGGAAAPAANPRQQAPIDLTGYWVSVITEDWRYRMVAPPKGDHPGLPLNPEGN